MLSIFKKKIDQRTVILFPWYLETLGGREMNSCYFGSYIDGTFRVFSINYKIEDDSANAFSISFFDAKATNDLLFSPKGKAKVTLEIETLGTSVDCTSFIICTTKIQSSRFFLIFCHMQCVIDHSRLFSNVFYSSH